MVPQVPGLSAALQGAYNKLTQQNVATRNAFPVVVPSSQGSDVTYRFDPELQALAVPSSTDSGPGLVLQPSSFPALIVIICDEEDLVTWDSIHANVTTRWIPMEKRNWAKKVFVDWWLHGSISRDTSSPLDINISFACARHATDATETPPPICKRCSHGNAKE